MMYFWKENMLVIIKKKANIFIGMEVSKILYFMFCLEMHYCAP